MGAFWISRRELAAIVKEAAGYKSGLVLTTDDIRPIVPAEYEILWKKEDEHAFRLRAEEFDDMFAQILYRLGASEVRDGTPANIRMLAKYYHSPEFELYEKVAKFWVDFLMKRMRANDQVPGSLLDPEPVARQVAAECGLRGVDILLEILEEWNRDMHRHFWSRVRRTEWSDMRELADLFQSERLETQHGKFFDQRFIDYLYANFARIDGIHWRQFEGLTCQFFEREGFDVEIGSGRGDEGIDARIWNKSKDRSLPPLILVQCKREKNKIKSTVVKALYTDVLHERADSGLIVTTSELSPAAIRVKNARAYPIEQADRTTLRRWLEAMRTKG